MTLMELQNILGEQLQKVVDGQADVDEARAVASLAKQMINNSDVILRTDKFAANNGVRINKVVGE